MDEKLGQPGRYPTAEEAINEFWKLSDRRRNAQCKLCLWRCKPPRDLAQLMSGHTMEVHPRALEEFVEAFRRAGKMMVKPSLYSGVQEALMARIEEKLNAPPGFATGPVMTSPTPIPPVTEADIPRAVEEVTAILHLAWPVVKHTQSGCHCKDCEAKFKEGYIRFVQEYQDTETSVTVRESDAGTEYLFGESQKAHNPAGGIELSQAAIQRMLETMDIQQAYEAKWKDEDDGKELA